MATYGDDPVPSGRLSGGMGQSLSGVAPPSSHVGPAEPCSQKFYVLRSLELGQSHVHTRHLRTPGLVLSSNDCGLLLPDHDAAPERERQGERSGPPKPTAPAAGSCWIPPPQASSTYLLEVHPSDSVLRRVH